MLRSGGLENTPLSRIQGANQFKFRILVSSNETDSVLLEGSQEFRELSGRVQNPAAWKQQNPRTLGA